MDKKFFFLFFLFAFLSESLFAQVSVNPLTGAGSVNIPLYTVRSGQVAIPINLSYNGTGIRPNDVEGTAGMGWNVQASGQVSRVVRGIPDDIIKDNGSNNMLGWMSSHMQAAISGFNIANNGSTCSNETTDISFITSHFSYQYDTEPDIFYVNAPGLSCQLVWEPTSGSFKPTNYQDLKITYVMLGSGPNPYTITSFTITNDKGIKYVFGAGETITQKSSGGSQIYFKNRFLQYQYGISYYDNWKLTSVSDPNGNAVTLNYATEPQTTGSDSVALYIGGSTTYSLQYRISNTVTPQRLSSINVSNANSSYNALSFQWTTLTNINTTGQTIISSITGSGKNYQFSYSPVIYSATGFTRSFLRNCTDSGPGCSSPVSYQFSYLGETFNTNNYYTSLPDSSSTKRDYWGYYSSTASATTLLPSIYGNPDSTRFPQYIIDASASGGNAYSCFLYNGLRRTDTSSVATGTLNKITNAMGGNTTIFYESNDYSEAITPGTGIGGGLRVKKIIDSVGNGSTNNIIRSYSYLNPSTGKSSGKPITLPEYAFLMPYSGSYTGCQEWGAASIFSAYDLSPEDHTIMYAYCKMSQSGAGSTLYQYNIPATYWDVSAKPSCSGCSTTEWYPTTNYLARNNCTSSYGVISNHIYTYPFIPNPNYDFERGLPVKVTNYNDGGTEVSETNYTYSRSYAPSAITAFKYETNPNGSLLTYGYNKYIIYYNTSELSATVINKVYDSQNLTVARADTTTYTYGSSNHKLVTQIQARNSDNSLLTTRINYTKDYTAAAGSNANVTAIYNLQQQNVNIPVETYSQVTRSSTTYTTAASLNLFKGVTPGSITLYLPSNSYKMVQPSGLTTFAPMTISGQTLTSDTHYFGTANFDTYDNTGSLLTLDDNNKNIGTTIINHITNQPIAVFKNAAYAEIGFSDFESHLADNGYTFTVSGTPAIVASSHAGFGCSLPATTQTVSKTVSKNAIAANYIFSIWINAPSGTNTLNISFNGGSATGYTYTGTGSWKYYEWKIPVGSYSSPMTISFTSSQNIIIDDVLFYPDVAEVTTATYDPNTNFKLATTNTNGVSAYFTYDHWGRLLFAYDQDHNIVKKNTYVLPADVKSFNYAAIEANPNPSQGVAYGYYIAGPDTCSANGATVTWYFGDGTNATTALLATTNHTYSSVGKKSITATITSPAFGTFNIGPDTVNVIGSIHVTYENYTYSNGNITNVTFKNLETDESYSFTGATLNNSNIHAGKYEIVVTLTGGTKYVSGSGPTGPGYGSVYLNGSCWSTCSSFQSSDSYTYHADLSGCTALDFQVVQATGCP